MRLLITGCQRSGTTWMAECLRAAGIDCGHERAFRRHRVETSGWVAEASWTAAPFTPLADTYVVHIVRHPLKSIRSSAEMGTFGPDRQTAWAKYAAKWCPEILEGRDRIQRATIYWNRWNQLVKADEVLQLEQINLDVVTRLARIVSSDAALQELPPPANEKSSRKKGTELSWADVPDLDLDLTATYGYEIPQATR